MSNGCPSIALSGLSLTRVWHDDDLVELCVAVTTCNAHFSTTVYAGHRELSGMLSSLAAFATSLSDGLSCEIGLGQFGPAFANGAWRLRLQFVAPGTLWVWSRQQADFAGPEFPRRGFDDVADEATLLLASEPGLFDAFVAQLSCLAKRRRDDARLECVRSQ